VPLAAYSRTLFGGHKQIARCVTVIPAIHPTVIQAKHQTVIPASHPTVIPASSRLKACRDKLWPESRKEEIQQLVTKDPAMLSLWVVNHVRLKGKLPV
jgi:hypothetical protein